MGPLIIGEETPPDVDHDIFAVPTNRRSAEDEQLTDDFGDVRAGRTGNFAKASVPDVTLQPGERLRLRPIDAAVDRIFPVLLKGLEGKIAALDGMPIATPKNFDLPVPLPTQRMDIVADARGPVEFEMIHRSEPHLLGSLPASGSVASRRSPILALSPNDLPKLGDVTQKLSLTIMGCATGGRHSGGNIWAFNNVSDLRRRRFGHFRRGETATISPINDTSFPHGIHLHGHHFHNVAANGALGDQSDTALANPGETKDIVCAFDKPGRWTLRCRMLSHQVGGMKTWAEVA